MPDFDSVEINTISDEVLNIDSYEDNIISDYYSNQVIFSDLNEDNYSDDMYLKNMEVIVQSVLNMLSTDSGERIFRPNFGASLRRINFAPINNATSARLKQMLINSIESWDSRIRVNRNLSRVVPLPDESSYEIHVTYEVPSLSLNKNELVFNYEVTT